MTKIYIDADACPVRAESLKVAHRHKLETYVVSNGGLRPDPHPLVHTIVVEGGPDVADIWIADRIQSQDICITADIPLAAKCIETGAQALRHNGDAFTPANIGNQMATRDLMNDLRAADPFRQGHGKPFSKADRSRFLDMLDRAVQNAKRKA